MTMKKELWELEAQRKSDAKDRLSDRADDGGVLSTAEASDPQANMSAPTRAAVNAYTQSGSGSGGTLATAVASNRVSLKDAGEALVSTASLPADHPDRIKAIADYDAAKARGDSIDSHTDCGCGGRADALVVGELDGVPPEARAGLVGRVDGAHLVLDGRRYVRADFTSDDSIREMHYAITKRGCKNASSDAKTLRGWCGR